MAPVDPTAAGVTLTAERDQTTPAADHLCHTVACHTNGQRSLCGLDVTDVPWCGLDCPCPDLPCVVCHALEDADPEHERCKCVSPCPECG